MVAAYVSINLIWMTQWSERKRGREGIMNGWMDERMEGVKGEVVQGLRQIVFLWFAERQSVNVGQLSVWRLNGSDQHSHTHKHTRKQLGSC